MNAHTPSQSLRYLTVVIGALVFSLTACKDNVARDHAAATTGNGTTVADNTPVNTTTNTNTNTTIGNEVDDSVITTRVKTALLSDQEVKSMDIKVETRKGEVMLSGFADNQTQIDRSVNVARGVDGVKAVDNKLGLKDGSRTVGTAIDDGVVTTSVKTALLNDSSVKGLDISVATRKGEVQLSGFVDNQQQADQAVALTRNVSGVTSVVNHMEIKK